jgi:prefoldin alpha subunit
MDDNQMREKYMEMQFLDQQMKQIEDHLKTVEDQEADVLVTKDALENFSKLKEGDETLMPLSNGIFARASLKDNKRLLVNVGNGVVVEKTIPDTIALMDEQLKELTRYKLKLTEKMDGFTDKVRDIEKFLQESAKKGD